MYYADNDDLFLRVAYNTRCVKTFLRIRLRRATNGLREMFGNKFGHLKHADCSLAVKDLLEGSVCIDVPPILRILQVVLFDVLPEFFYDFRARHRALANDLSQVRADVHRLHKG